MNPFCIKNREISHKTFSINNEKYEIIKLPDGLLKKAKEQDNLKEFIKTTKHHIRNYITKEKANTDINSYRISDDISGPLYDIFKSAKGEYEVKVITFGTSNTALTLLMHTVWTYKIYIQDYNKDTGELTLRYYLYDHFGLDANDIFEHRQQLFLDWFVLQHFYGYKPFATEFCFDEKIILK